MPREAFAENKALQFYLNLRCTTFCHRLAWQKNIEIKISVIACIVRRHACEEGESPTTCATKRYAISLAVWGLLHPAGSQ